MNVYKITASYISAFVLAEDVNVAIKCFIDRFEKKYYINVSYIDRVEKIAGDNVLPNSKADCPDCLIVSQEDICEWIERKGCKVTRKDK